MKINWKVRLKNKYFWLALIPALILLVQQVLGVFGVSLDASELQEQLLAIVGTVFTLLALVGVVNDPTTKGISDSNNALTYTEPKASDADGEEEIEYWFNPSDVEDYEGEFDDYDDDDIDYSDIEEEGAVENGKEN